MAKTRVAQSCFLQNTAVHNAQPSTHFLGQQSPLFSSLKAARELILWRDRKGGRRGVENGPRGLLLVIREGLPSLHQVPVGVLFFLPPSVLPASCSEPALLTRDLVCSCWHGVSTIVPSLGQAPPGRLHTGLCSRPRGGGGTGCCPACIRVGLALFKQLGSSCKLPNTYFGRSAWPAAGAFHYSGDISLNMLQFLHPSSGPSPSRRTV